MIILIKFLILALLLFITSWLGIILSKKYSNRVKELKQVKTGLNIIENKIKFTYEPIPEIFKEISTKFIGSVSGIFKNSYENMKNIDAGKAWESSIDIANCNLNKEDKDVIKGLGKLLGKTDVDGQISQLNLINNFLDTQIKQAEAEKEKGEKLYRKLGVISGLIIVIALI